MDGFQQAALSLYELSDAEQQWLLAQLPADDRQRLQAALEALRLQMASTHVAAAAVARTIEDDLNKVKRWDAATLVEVLNDEPDWVVVAVLSVLDTSMVEPFLEQLGLPRAAKIRSALPSTRAALKPRLQEVLLETLLRKAKQRDLPASAVADFESVLKRAANAA
ncbi:MAG: hypothetical protein HY308_18600 [Gammaproteobacteria bacterium]|nr:hypothetical protein [Gammaproteobacteria bacterium]